MKKYRVFYMSGHRFEAEGVFYIDRVPNCGLNPLIVLGAETLNGLDKNGKLHGIFYLDPRAWVMSPDMEVIYSPFTSDEDWVQQELRTHPAWHRPPDKWQGPTILWLPETSQWKCLRTGRLSRPAMPPDAFADEV